MISNLMDEGEALKTKIKNLSLELISSSVNLKDSNTASVRRSLSEVEKNSLQLMSVLDIAYISGLISQMNARIVKEEFQNLMNDLKSFAENSNGGDSVFSLMGESEVLDRKSVLANGAGNGQLPVGASGQAVRNSDNPGKAPAGGGHNGVKHKRKDLRRMTVLEFIKGHGEVSIKDIVPNINGCSEKTIQRELTALVKEGKIKKIGERRWSRYSMVI